MLAFFLFFSVALATIVGSHAFVYFSIAYFFGLEGFARRWLLLAVLALSASFFAASALAHWYDNIFTRGLYWISATWLGVLSNLFFILVAVWIAWLIVRLAGLPASPLVFGTVAIGATALVSAYGLYAADDITVRHETVFVRDLPTAWEGKKIVQVTDVHLGHIIRASFATRIVRAINAENPAAVAIVGDLFDGMDGHLE